MNTLSKILVAASLAPLAYASHAYAQHDEWEVPEDVAIGEVVSAGTGCVGGADGAVTLLGPTQLTIDFDTMAAHLGGGAGFPERRKFCAYSIDVFYPAGWTYAVEAVFARASARLGEGVTGTLGFSSWFQGQSTTEIFTPKTIDRSGIVRDLQEARQDVWAPCIAEGENNYRALTFRGAVNVTGPDAVPSRLTLAGPVHLFLKWKRCGEPQDID